MVDDNNPFRGADLEGDPEYLKHLYTTRKPFKQVIQEGEKVFGVPPGFPTTVDVYEKREPPLDIDGFARQVDELAERFAQQRKLAGLGEELAGRLKDSDFTSEDLIKRVDEFVAGQMPTIPVANIKVTPVAAPPDESYSWKFDVEIQPGYPGFKALLRIEQERKLSQILGKSVEWIQVLRLSDETLAALVKGKGKAVINLEDYGESIREQTTRWLAGDHPVDKLQISLEDLQSTTQKKSPAIDPPLTPEEKVELRTIGMHDYFKDWPIKCLYYVRSSDGVERRHSHAIERMRTSKYDDVLFQIQDRVQDPNEFVHVRQLKVRKRNGNAEEFKILALNHPLDFTFSGKPPLGKRTKAARSEVEVRTMDQLVALGRAMGISEEFLTERSMDRLLPALGRTMFISARQTGKSRAISNMMSAFFKVAVPPRKYWAMMTKRGPNKALLEIGKFRKQQ